MSNKTQRSRFQSDLLKANTEGARLAQICQQLEQQKSQLVNILCAILMKEHKGAVDLGPDDIRNAQGLMINCRSLDRMGMMRVRALSVEAGKLTVTDDAPPVPQPAAPGPQLVPAEPAQVEPEPPQAPLTCSDPWHADENATGIRCAMCGDSRKLAPEMA